MIREVWFSKLAKEIARNRVVQGTRKIRALAAKGKKTRVKTSQKCRWARERFERHREVRNQQ